MTQGDAVGCISSVTAAAFLAIQPGAGIEWIIHNIYHSADAALYVVEGGLSLLFDEDSAKGSWSAYFFHLTNTHTLKVKNTNASTKLIGYDGIVSKE